MQREGRGKSEERSGETLARVSRKKHGSWKVGSKKGTA